MFTQIDCRGFTNPTVSPMHGRPSTASNIYVSPNHFSLPAEEQTTLNVSNGLETAVFALISLGMAMKIFSIKLSSYIAFISSFRKGKLFFFFS